MSRAISVMLAMALAVLPPSTLGQTGVDKHKHVTLPPRVATLVIPILDAEQEAFDGPRPMDQGEGSHVWRVGVLMGKLFGNRTSVSDEALVVLLHYYVGEANGGDQLQEIICRGKRMLPYLRKYQSSSPEIPQRHYSKEVLLELQTVRENFKDVTDEINKGHSAIACQSRP